MEEPDDRVLHQHLPVGGGAEPGDAHDDVDLDGGGVVDDDLQQHLPVGGGKEANA